VIIIWDSSIGVILHLTLLQLYPCYYGMHIIYFPHLLSTNQKCTQLYPPAAQKLKKIWSTSIWSSRWAIVIGQLPAKLLCLSTAMLPRVFDLVFCKTLIDNKYYILWHLLFCIYFLYGMRVNLILVHIYYEHSIWPQY
jgi:hypothetical protein